MCHFEQWTKLHTNPILQLNIRVPWLAHKVTIQQKSNPTNKTKWCNDNVLPSYNNLKDTLKCIFVTKCILHRLQTGTALYLWYNWRIFPIFIQVATNAFFFWLCGDIMGCFSDCYFTFFVNKAYVLKLESKRPLQHGAIGSCIVYDIFVLTESLWRCQTNQRSIDRFADVRILLTWKQNATASNSLLLILYHILSIHFNFPPCHPQHLNICFTRVLCL